MNDDSKNTMNGIESEDNNKSKNIYETVTGNETEINNDSTETSISNFGVIIKKLDSFFLPKERKIFMFISFFQIISCFFTWVADYDEKCNLFITCFGSDRGYLFVFFLLFPILIFAMRFFNKSSKRNLTAYIVNFIISIIELVIYVVLWNSPRLYGDIMYGFGAHCYGILCRIQIIYSFIIIISSLIKKRRKNS